MAQEFIIRKGYIALDDSQLTGSLSVTGAITGSILSGSFIGDGSQLSGVTGATTASYVEYSNVANKPTLVSGSSQVSFNGIVDKPTLVSGSSQITYSDLTGIPSGIVSGSAQVTYSGLTGIPSGIISGSSQITNFGIFATTGSNGFNGSQAITGSLTVTGQVVAQTLNVQQVTSSIIYSSGSNIFGNSLSNTQQFTGSVGVTGSLVVIGTGSFSDSVTSPTLFTDQIGIATNNIGAKISVFSGTSPNLGLSLEPSGWNTAKHRFNVPVSGDTSILSFNWTGLVVDSALYATSAIGISNGFLTFSTANSAVSPTEHMRITSTGNVGIGTTNPSQILHTVGDGIAFQRSTNNDFGIAVDILKSRGTFASPLDIQNGDTILQMRSAIYSGGAYRYLNTILTQVDGTFISGQNPPIRIVFNTNLANGSSAERMRLDASGNLGLGVTPSAWGSTNKVFETTAGTSMVGRSDFSLWGRNFYYNSSDAGIYTANGHATGYFQTSGQHLWATAPSGTANCVISFTQAMTLDASGNLMVGGTSTLYTASGRGNINVNGSSTAIISLSVGSSTANSSYIYFDNNNLNILNAKTGGELYLSTNGATRLTIASTGAATFSSSVSVGSSSNTGQLLFVRGTNNTASSNTTFWSDTAVVATFRNESTTTNTISGTQFQLGAGSAISAVGGLLESANQAALIFHTGGNGAVPERMRITSGGNVGIGTCTPATKLHIDMGTISSDTNTIHLSSTDSSGTNKWGIAWYSGNGADFRGKVMADNNGKLYLDSIGGGGIILNGNGGSGNVGIGTTNPGAQLAIFDTNNSRAYQMSFGYETTETFRLGNNNSTGKFTFTQLGNSNGFRFTSSAPNAQGIIFDINTSQFVVNGDTGNVGIGTTSPGSRLTVDGGDITLNAANAAANYYMYLNRKNGQDGHILFQVDNTNAWQLAADNTSNSRNLYFYSYGTNSQVLTLQRATGNVGINNTSPSYRLHVSSTTPFGYTGGGITKQHLINSKTASSSGTALKLFYVGFSHAVRLYLYILQDSNNIATATADFTTAYGASSGGITQSSRIGNISSIEAIYNNGGSPAYTIDVTVNYTGAAPTIFAAIEGVSNDAMYKVD